MKSLASLLLASWASLAAHAQYCTPTFQNGCFNWMTQSVSVGALDWSAMGTECTVSDHTALSTPLVAGEPLSMTVVNGNWCGCAVWVDLDNSGSFESTENLYSTYVGGDPSYSYVFPLEIPAGTLPGSYRMRVISPWGSDGTSTAGTNGFGPCGNYQYGNFQDFTLEVTAPTAVAERSEARPFTAWPTHTLGLVQLRSDARQPLERITVVSADGRLVHARALASPAGHATVDLSDQPAGLYFIRMAGSTLQGTARVVKE